MAVATLIGFATYANGAAPEKRKSVSEDPALRANSSRSARAQSPPVAEAWRPEPYPGGSVLPPGFVGVDPSVFLEHVLAAADSMKKDAYETTAEFKARSAGKRALLDPIDPNSAYAIRMPEILLTYSADRASYDVTQREPCSNEEGAIPNSAQWVVCKVSPRSRSVRSSEGRNAYGATVEVRSTTGSDYAIAIPSLSAVLTHYNGVGQRERSYTDTIQFAPSEARELRTGTLSVLFVGRVLDAQKIFGRPVTNVATFSSPSANYVTRPAVPFEVVKIVFYVVETGRILFQREF